MKAQSSSPRQFPAILAGAGLLFLLIPLLHWLDRGSVGNNLEMDVPNPGGLGLLVVLVLANGLVMLLARYRGMSRRSMLILYVMFSVALPVCGVGVMHGLFSSITARQREYVNRMRGATREHPNRLYEQARAYQYPKLDAGVHERFLDLFDPLYAERNQIRDARSQALDITGDYRRFWTGKELTGELKRQYDHSGWGLARTVRETWCAVPWHVWLPPLLYWGGFLSLWFLGTMCLASLLHGDWVRRENPPFPVAQAPLALLGGDGTEDGREPAAGPFRTPVFWVAFTLGVLLLGLGGLAHYQLLPITLDGAVTFQRIDFLPILVSPPWNGIAQNVLFLSPLMIGLAWMVHQDVLRGGLIVFAVIQFARMALAAAGPALATALRGRWDAGAVSFHYPELATGAALVFILVLVWRQRALFAWRRLPSDAEDAEGYMPRRVAVLLLLTLGGLVSYAVDLGATGLSGVYTALLFVFWTLGGGLVLARCRIEAGLAANSAHVANEISMSMRTGGGAHGLGNLAAMTNGVLITSSAMPGLLAAQLEGLYLAGKVRLRPRTLAVAVRGDCVPLSPFPRSVQCGCIGFPEFQAETGGVGMVG